MRFVPVNGEEQGILVLHRTRELLIRPRGPVATGRPVTVAINSLPAM